VLAKMFKRAVDKHTTALLAKITELETKVKALELEIKKVRKEIDG